MANNSKFNHIPEITFKAIILSLVLTVILTAANAYLGLKVGLTISASIPAAVISMGVLRFFKKHNILENNIVQTAASAGEALTAGIIFTMPALIIIHYWFEFKYIHTVVIAFLGGALGILFSVPLRRVLLADTTLKFPEGTAIGNILKASTLQNFGIKNLFLSGLFGGLISLFQTGFQFLASTLQFWTQVGNTIIGVGLGLNPALIGAGYIIGINSSIAILFGIMVGWIIGIPLIGFYYGIPTGFAPTDLAMYLWDQYIRYIGLGVMMIGGFIAVIGLLKPMYFGIKASIQSVKDYKTHGLAAIPRTERDLPIHYVFWGIILLLVPVFCGLLYMNHVQNLGLSESFILGTSSVMLVYILVGGFIFSSVCAYFAGLVGSSANPLSSLALIALIFASLLTVFLFNGKLHIGPNDRYMIGAASLVIVITAFICASASISNDTIQDLKAGQMVGATPWKQQVMLLVGVLVASLIIPVVLNLLFNAYGMAGVFPREGMDKTQMLTAPQASLMAAVINGIFTGNVNWLMIIVGMILAVICLIINKIFQNVGFHLPLLAVGLGVYLPIDTSSSLVLGGVLAYIVKHQLVKKYKGLSAEEFDQVQQASHQKALLIASGLVAGSAIMGVVLAVPFVIAGTTNALRLLPTATPEFIPQVLAIIVTAILFIWVVRATTTQIKD